MIIKGSLRVLKRDDTTRQERTEAVSDIDEEVERLNRVVNDVLDFARPIQFEFSECDLNRLCREAMAAATADDAPVACRFQADPSLPIVITDTERLRLALINVLANARHAVAAQQGRFARDPGFEKGSTVAVADADDVVMSTTVGPTGRAIISVRDRGIGIEPHDASRIFDPYFTTKRRGTGLGLPIARNIVEGLGGCIIFTSASPNGSEVRIELPRDGRVEAGAQGAGMSPDQA